MALTSSRSALLLRLGCYGFKGRRKLHWGVVAGVRLPFEEAGNAEDAPMTRDVGAGGSCVLDRERGAGGWGRGGTDGRASAVSDCERREARQRLPGRAGPAQERTRGERREGGQRPVEKKNWANGPNGREGREKENSLFIF
jgi:hypothetical protein